ncbi:MAG: Sjogren's syndrome/scleroderma autoantigen 1 family protein [Candidatus Bathyarchaeia archaeon]|nr:Sjogren's syndrome/scleroderma autoantigen 1 family protein [Candidatus Bathyarchaeia archaeon]MDI6904007.1 Sjogren's syndrome/scleroderma autoantigen 1 family protein [Candidatus Bathyarchaeia archaeon]
MSRNKVAEEQNIKRMADLLRQGSTLTDLACPACASPLFRLRSGNLWCAKCQKKVIIVKEGEEPAKITGSMVLDTLEATLLAKVQEIQNKMQHEENVEELQKLGTVLSGLLENLEKIRKAKKV